MAVTGSIHVLHVVGPVTDEVFSFLGPATRALAKSGRAQQIVAVDTPEHRHNVRQLDACAAVIRVPKLGNPMTQWQAVARVCRQQFLEHEVDAVHVHGLIPFLLVSLALRSSGDRTPIVYSPHGSRSLGDLRFAGRLAMLAARSVVRPTRSSAIVNVPREAEALDAWSVTDLVESPVADLFFSIVRSEADEPLIVTGGRTNGVRSIEMFSQLAVLLSGAELGLEFHWLGTVPTSAAPRLRAAGVVLLPIEHDDECAANMAEGWMYVAPWSTRGFPLFLVQAMAVGLPCVALDCEQHREVIEHGKTGFLCTSEQEMVHQIALLVDNPMLRGEMGAAARAVAIARFSESRFREKLLTAYSTRWKKT